MQGTTPQKKQQGAPSVDDYDPFDPAVIADPFPYYRVLQQEAPIHEIKKRELFVISRFEDVVAAAQDWARFSTTWGPGPRRTESPIASVLQSDPPQHTRLRSIIAKAFTPRAVQACAPLIESCANQCIDSILENADANWIEDYAIPIPVIVISEMLGVPREDRALFRKWSDDIVGAIGGKVDPTESQREFNDYFGKVVAARQQDPRDDVISKLLQPNSKGERLTVPEVISFCLSLLVAGNETTTGLIGNLFFQLAKRPEDWKRLKTDPSLIPSAIEESLRFEAPNQGLFRHTVEEVEIRGVKIPAGRKVLLLFGAAGRDPDQFDRPDEFDITRGPNRHIAFGAGIHHCLGASLGRLEANTALRVATERIDEIRLIEQSPPYVPIFFIRCPESLQLAASVSANS